MLFLHKAVYVFTRLIIIPVFYLVLNYRWKVYSPKSKTYLVLMNHTTDLDFFLCGLCFRKHMYFVASEQILRSGFGGKIVKVLGNPIPRKKGDDADDTVKAIISRLASGINVCMNVEGNRSFSGVTGWISPNNVKLLRESGAGLVNFAIHGGYLANPRWSHGIRRGRIWGYAVNEYTPEMISCMSDEEIMNLIRHDLYVNAYEDQKERHYKYTGKNLAENLETALFVCPECLKVSTLHSKGYLLKCDSCGFEYVYDEYGYISGNSDRKPRFNDILSWSRWQTEYIKEKLVNCEHIHQQLFSDNNIKAFIVHPGRGKELLLNGDILLYKDSLTLRGTDTEMVFGISEIVHMSVFTMDTLLFTTDAGYYQIESHEPYSALKYLICWRILNGKDYIG